MILDMFKQLREHLNVLQVNKIKEVKEIKMSIQNMKIEFNREGDNFWKVKQIILDIKNLITQVKSLSGNPYW